ncbi:MAG: ChaN family lipoprotein [Planctomycetota bacterium]
MRSLILLSILSVLGACASTGPRIVVTDTDTVTSVGAVAAAVADADVVALGELHQTPAVHQTHHALLRALYERRPNLVIAMEMFERDVQTVLLQYLNGLIDEDEFRAKARPWPDYARDYRPVIEFAKQKQLMVLAANAPRPLARKAAREGLDAVMGDKNLARTTTAPQDDYWEAFQELMEGHAGMFGPGGMERFYAAQCLKDDTMAESIVDHLKGFEPDNRPLAVLICGRAHSDHGWGTVQRIKERMPGIDVRVLSAETVEDVAGGVYETSNDTAEFVVVAPKPERKPVMVGEVAKRVVDEAAQAAQQQPGQPEAGEAALPTENPEGMRPAFGFMPNYNVDGVGVDRVTEGGPAEAAGIEDGDIIVAVNGKAVPDIETYMEVLDTLIIGRNATVRVRREQAEVDLQVKVGSRGGR